MAPEGRERGFVDNFQLVYLSEVHFVWSTFDEFSFAHVFALLVELERIGWIEVLLADEGMFPLCRVLLGPHHLLPSPTEVGVCNNNVKLWLSRVMSHPVNSVSPLGV